MALTPTVHPDPCPSLPGRYLIPPDNSKLCHVVTEKCRIFSPTLRDGQGSGWMGGGGLILEIFTMGSTCHFYCGGGKIMKFWRFFAIFIILLPQVEIFMAVPPPHPFKFLWWGDTAAWNGIVHHSRLWLTFTCFTNQHRVAMKTTVASLWFIIGKYSQHSLLMIEQWYSGLHL